MKDRQIQTSGTQPSVPLLSPVLHWMAVPVLVFLRSGFGYSFLSPKSVFISFAWASALFFTYARIEQGAWVKHSAIASFAASASALYLLHLLIAFAGETRRRGKHDFYSGTSHLLRFPGFSQLRSNPSFETILHLWLEPITIFIFATALRATQSEQRLSFWLLLVAAAMWLKEFINYWYNLRSEKKHGDIIEDAEEKMPDGAGGLVEVPLPSAGGRKARVKRS